MTFRRSCATSAPQPIVGRRRKFCNISRWLKGALLVEGSIPDVGVATAKALNDLSATRAALRTMVVSADGEDLSSIVAPHGRFGPINMYEWLLFIGGHEARHTEQVREAGRMLA